MAFKYIRVRLFGETSFRDVFERGVISVGFGFFGEKGRLGVSLSEIMVIITLIVYAFIPSCKDNQRRATARMFP